MFSQSISLILPYSPQTAMTMFRKILILVLAILPASGAVAQSIDEKIGKAMNESDWFARDSIYKSAPKDSIHPFLEVFSRCLLGNRLNRPEVSIPAFQELLNTQSEYLGLDNAISSAYMFGMDLSRTGHNAEAAAMTRAILASTGQYLDSVSAAGLRATAMRYEALTAYTPYQIDFPADSPAAIPFRIMPVWPADKGSVLMHIDDSRINGIEADITFDTGAGVNTISPEMAARYNLTPLDSTVITVSGVGLRDGYIAMAREVKIGNITVRDVPFSVMSLSSGNDEADQYFDSFNIIIGSELMLQLKDLTLDFDNNLIEVPTTAPLKTDCAPNLCFSPSMNFLTEGTVLGTPMMMLLDSGDASFGSLAGAFFNNHKDYITGHASVDSFRQAGVAGVVMTECYNVPGMPVRIGNATVNPPEMAVLPAINGLADGAECTIGLRTMMLYGKIHFNLVDFVLTTEPRAAGAQPAGGA